MAITSVPIRTNPDLRPSRLVKNIPAYISRSVLVMIRMYMVYNPFKFFGILSIFFGTIGSIAVARFLYYFSIGLGDGHVQSVVLGSLFVGASLVFLVSGFVADLININRNLLESIKNRIGQLEDRL